MLQRCSQCIFSLLIVATALLSGARALAAEALPGANHWALKPVVIPSVPQVSDAAGVRNPVDAFILSKLQSQELTPSPEADRRTLIRRVSFDLTGLPPTPEEIESFVADPDPQAYDKLVDRLLASPRHGERWARHWLDVVRFAETNGYETNTPRPNAWPYRDYVIRSLNQDKPYDQFVREQIAGDHYGVDEATGFLVGGPWDEVKSPDPQLTAQQRSDELHDMSSTVASTFLGLTAGCARCHDHKFDPISQTDYFRLQAVFAGVQHGERPLGRADFQAERSKRLAAARRALTGVEWKLDQHEPAVGAGTGKRPALNTLRNVDRFAPFIARFVRFTINNDAGIEPCLDELEIYTASDNGNDSENVALASAGAKATASSTFPGSEFHKLEHLNDGLHGNGRSWISGEQRTGWVQVELPRELRIDRVVWGRDREGVFTDRLATKYRIEVALSAQGPWQTVASDTDRVRYVHPAFQEKTADAKNETPAKEDPAVLALGRERLSLEAEVKALLPVAVVYAGKFVDPGETRRLHRGDPMQPKEVVAPGGLSALNPQLEMPADAPEQERRVKLAEWITDPANPLTARVIVNRLWHYHFGRGIVDTPSDFGQMGSRPTHPELLDWLASQLPVNGWRLKPIHKLLVTSATYRQSSDANPSALAADAENTLLWRYAPRRLEAESIRDSILLVSGKLDLSRTDGPGFDTFQPNTNYVRVYTPKEDFGPTEWRRMVFQFKVRREQDGTFGVFDCPDGAQIAPKRPTSTTPLQALNLLNGSFLLQQAELFGERLTSEVGLDPVKQAERGFQIALGRSPTQAERDAAAKLIAQHGLPALCRALFNANEFVYVR